MGLQPAFISPPDYAVAAWEITREIYESTDTLIFVQMLRLDLVILTLGFAWALLAYPRVATIFCQVSPTKHSTKPLASNSLFKGLLKTSHDYLHLNIKTTSIIHSKLFLLGPRTDDCLLKLPCTEAPSVLTRLLSLPSPQCAKQCL